MLGKSDGTNTTFTLLDGLGSVLASISNTAGSAVVKGNQVYGPYGNQRYQQGTLGTAKGFTGQYNDSLTVLDYFNARYYDPVAGVFLSADTVQGNLQGLNPYAYVNGNPETHNDPTGNYYATEIPLSQKGGAIGYALPGTAIITTVINSGYLGSITTLNGQSTPNASGLVINTFTQQQEAANGSYNPDTDPNTSLFAKLAQMTGWTALQQAWDNPNASWQDKAGAIWNFLGTNANNVFQFAMIFGGGPEGDAEAAVANEVEHALADGGSGLPDLLNELKASGVNFTGEDVVGITRSAETGSLNWLENGTVNSGLIHIIARHADEFAKAFGITNQEDISRLILDMLGSQTPNGMNRALRIFSDVTWGDFTHDLEILEGDNGYIVTSFPV
ncbi:MAG: hypothetical protein NVS3B14_05750 [Ktedonobacteraceae bacterium]